MNPLLTELPVTIWIQLALNVFVGILLCRAVVSHVKKLSKLKESIASGSLVNGLIIDVEASKDDEGAVIYHPVFEYVTLGGRKVVARGEMGTSRKPEVGKRVEVLYDPADEHSFHVKGSKELLFSRIILCVLIGALIGLVIGTFYMIRNPNSFLNSTGETI